MGLLKKLGHALVEEVPDEIEIEDLTYEEEDLADAELSDVNTSTLISDIYAQNNLAEMSQSIFKVEELVNSLPKEMVTETKQASVLAILSSFALTVIGVTTDGEDRISVLRSVKSKINSDSEEKIADCNDKIEEYKKAIAELEVEISNAQTETKLSNELITSEMERISSLIKFIGGEAS